MRRSTPPMSREAQAEAKQEALAREKQKQDAINSGTVAIDFAHTGELPLLPLRLRRTTAGDARNALPSCDD